jgi:hypothetical protein
MNITKEILNNNMSHVSKKLNLPITVIKQYDNKCLYKVGKYNYFGKDLVAPEFFGLMNVPFALSATVNFLKHSTRVSPTEKRRRRVMNNLLRHLNSWILRKHRWLESGMKTVRAAWVIEFGSTKNERHAHALLHFHEKTPAAVIFETYCYLSKISGETLESLGVRKDINVQMIADAQADCVSYFCKIEKGREFKTFDYSMGFFPIIERLFLPPDDSNRKKAA